MFTDRGDFVWVVWALATDQPQWEHLIKAKPALAIDCQLCQSRLERERVEAEFSKRGQSVQHREKIRRDRPANKALLCCGFCVSKPIKQFGSTIGTRVLSIRYFC